MQSDLDNNKLLLKDISLFILWLTSQTLNLLLNECQIVSFNYVKVSILFYKLYYSSIIRNFSYFSYLKISVKSTNTEKVWKKNVKFYILNRFNLNEYVFIIHFIIIFIVFFNLCERSIMYIQLYEKSTSTIFHLNHSMCFFKY